MVSRGKAPQPNGVPQSDFWLRPASAQATAQSLEPGISLSLPTQEEDLLWNSKLKSTLSTVTVERSLLCIKVSWISFFPKLEIGHDLCTWNCSLSSWTKQCQALMGGQTWWPHEGQLVQVWPCQHPPLDNSLGHAMWGCFITVLGCPSLRGKEPNFSPCSPCDHVNCRLGWEALCFHQQRTSRGLQICKGVALRVHILALSHKYRN